MVARALARIGLAAFVAAAAVAGAGARGGEPAPDAPRTLVFLDGPPPWRVVVEDDGRVAWAFLLRGEVVESEVWLYNVAPAPEALARPVGASGGRRLNPRDLCRTPPPPRIADERKVTARWEVEGGAVKGATVLHAGAPLARLAPGARPGWSAGAAKDGPLAKVLAPGGG